MKSSCKHIVYYKLDCIWLQMGITMEYNRTEEGTGQVTNLVEWAMALPGSGRIPLCHMMGQLYLKNLIATLMQNKCGMLISDHGI